MGQGQMDNTEERQGGFPREEWGGRIGIWSNLKVSAESPSCGCCERVKMSQASVKLRADLSLVPRTCVGKLGFYTDKLCLENLHIYGVYMGWGWLASLAKLVSSGSMKRLCDERQGALCRKMVPKVNLTDFHTKHSAHKPPQV